MNRFTPTGTETAPVLSPILAPLETVKSKINVVLGLNYELLGEQHQKGICGFLTSMDQIRRHGRPVSPKGPSIDQVIAKQLLMRSPARRSRFVGDGKSHGGILPINSINFEDNTNFTPIDRFWTPRRSETGMFGGITGDTPSNTAAIGSIARSILDFVGRKYAALTPRLGAANGLDWRTTSTRFETSRRGSCPPTDPPVVCVPTAKVNTSRYNHQSGLNSADDGSVRDTQTDAAIPTVGKFMMDMVVMAMACDRTAVATHPMEHTEAKHTFPWLASPITIISISTTAAFAPPNAEKSPPGTPNSTSTSSNRCRRQVMGPDNRSCSTTRSCYSAPRCRSPIPH